MQKGKCVLFLSTIGAFYSDLFNLKEHPNYSMLYEPWQHNIEKLYNHKKELEYQENSNYKLLCDVNLGFAEVMKDFRIEGVDESEIKELLRTGVVQFEDLKN